MGRFDVYANQAGVGYLLDDRVTSPAADEFAIGNAIDMLLSGY